MDSALDSDLRAIRLDDGPRFKPLRLEDMFTRVREWGEAHPSTSTRVPVYRPPSPRRYPRIHPLPLPFDCEESPSPETYDQAGSSSRASPLAQLFRYPELVPLVLDHFDQPRDLAKISRVSKEWCAVAQKKLYQHVWVRPWEDGCHFKLVMLFETLSRNPDLCRLVRRLDVRFFPLAARGTERSELDDQVQQALSNMQHLESLVWTRDRSLNPVLIEKISSLIHLRLLEISGHSKRYYEPSFLENMPALEDLRIMMPDSNLKHCLVDIVKALARREKGGLRGLGLICQSSPLIDDALLKVIAPSLSGLRRLNLWGCTRVTRDGVFALLDEAEHLEEMSIDAPPHSGLLDLPSAPSLDSLRTLSMSITSLHRSATHPIVDPADLPTLPPLPKLNALFLTLSGDAKFLPFSSFQHLYTQLIAPLSKLYLAHMVISSETLSFILSIPSLEELYISVNGRQTVLDCETISQSNLRVFHVNAPEAWGLNSDHLRDLAEKMKGLEQIGAGNRVYEVHRRYKDVDVNEAQLKDTRRENTEGNEMEVELCRWSQISTPGYFQFWRG